MLPLPEVNPKLQGDYGIYPKGCLCLGSINPFGKSNSWLHLTLSLRQTGCNANKWLAASLQLTCRVSASACLTVIEKDTTQKETRTLKSI